MFPGMDLYYTDPAQHLRTAGYYLHDLDRDLSDPSPTCEILLLLLLSTGSASCGPWPGRNVEKPLEKRISCQDKEAHQHQS